MKQKIRLALTGGGTGGHIMPLIALKKYLNDTNYEFFWYGEYGGLEENLAHRADIPFIDISSGKIRRYFDVRNFYEPFKNISGYFQALYSLKRRKIVAVFSKGGYTSLPVILAAATLHIPIYVHESDAVLGVSNAIGAKFAKKIFTNFDLSHLGDKYIKTGPLLGGDLLKNIEINKEENEKLEVLVIGGSQGSKKIFETIEKIAYILSDSVNFTVILGTQNKDFRNILNKYSNIKCYDFVSQEKLGTIYQKADIAVTRGSSLLWELATFGIHAIIIPLKESGNNHQYENAKYFKKQFGSDVINEDSPELSEKLLQLLTKYKDLRKIAPSTQNYYKPLQIIKTQINSDLL